MAESFSVRTLDRVLYGRSPCFSRSVATAVNTGQMFFDGLHQLTGSTKSFDDIIAAAIADPATGDFEGRSDSYRTYAVSKCGIAALQLQTMHLSAGAVGRRGYTQGSSQQIDTPELQTTSSRVCRLFQECFGASRSVVMAFRSPDGVSVHQFNAKRRRFIVTTTVGPSLGGRPRQSCRSCLLRSYEDVHVRQASIDSREACRIPGIIAKRIGHCRLSGYSCSCCSIPTNSSTIHVYEESACASLRVHQVAFYRVRKLKVCGLTVGFWLAPERYGTVQDLRLWTEWYGTV